MTIVTTMCKLLIAMLIGFYLFKKNILTKEVNAKLSSMIVQITCPCIILNSLSTVSHDDTGMVLKLFLAGVVMYVIFPILAWIITKIMRVPAHLRGTYIVYAHFFQTTPSWVIRSYRLLYGDSAIFYITIFNMPFSILFFSMGLHLLKKDAAIESGNFVKEKLNFRSFINNGIIASVASLVIYFANIPMPDIFYACVGFVGNITTPLSMIIIGASMAAASFGEIKKERGIWPMLPIRLAVMPVIVWFFMHLVTKDVTLDQYLYHWCRNAGGFSVAMGRRPYPRQSRSASIGVAISTIVSLVTIPIMAVLLGA